MSASLVGSEMCIRDRLYPSGTARLSEACDCMPSAAQSSSNVHGARSVSYTHLTLPTICSV
eukprot:7563894-Alexandrium_andersonii.AAC.1